MIPALVRRAMPCNGSPYPPMLRPALPVQVVLVWIILNKSAGGLYECLDVGVGYMQIMSTVGPNSQIPEHREAFASSHLSLSLTV